MALIPVVEGAGGRVVAAATEEPWREALEGLGEG